jgi:hypothetical protein
MKKIFFAITLILCTFVITACSSYPKACTKEAKVCPDGSAVGRTGPNCEFTKCPTVINAINVTVDNIPSNTLKSLNDEDIQIEIQNLVALNKYPDNKNINKSKYPITLGRYSKNGIVLVERYFCSDVCPDAGGVSIYFENITSEEQCSAIGGRPIINPAWRSFSGCAPNISN